MPPNRSSVRARAMSAAARPRSGGGGSSAPARAGGCPSPVRVAHGRPSEAAGRRSVAPVGPAVESHHELVVWVGPAAGPGAAGRAGRPGGPPVGASCSCGARARLGQPATGGPPGSCLVLGAVLAWVRIFLGIERPVRPARRSVPAGATPVGLEGAGIGTVVRRGSERAPCCAGGRWTARGVVGRRRGPVADRPGRRRLRAAPPAGARARPRRFPPRPVDPAAPEVPAAPAVPGAARVPAPLAPEVRAPGGALRARPPYARRVASPRSWSACHGAARPRGALGTARTTLRRAARTRPGWPGTAVVPSRRQRPGDGPWPAGGRRA